MLIFNNADNNEVPRHAWPANDQGTVVVTTRDYDTASIRTFQSFVKVRPFNEVTGTSVLLKTIEADANNPTAQKSAESIIKAMGGLPVALNQIGSFIKNSATLFKVPLEFFRDDFLNLSDAERNADPYEQTVDGVWHRSMTSLSVNARSLLNLLTYFQPDAIDMKILIQGSLSVSHDDFFFLQDKRRKVESLNSKVVFNTNISFSRNDTMSELHKNSLVYKSSTLLDGILSVHRVAQAVVINNHNGASRSKYFNAAIQTLSSGFPERWSEDTGHQIETWSSCENCLPHVHYLVTLREKFNIEVTNSQKYSELLLRCSW